MTRERKNEKIDGRCWDAGSNLEVTHAGKVPCLWYRRVASCRVLATGRLLGVTGTKYASGWWGIMQRDGEEERSSYPAIVSERMLASCKARFFPCIGNGGGVGRLDLLRLITFPSTHQSPMTVKRNASVLTMGTVRLNSEKQSRVSQQMQAQRQPIKAQCPTAGGPKKPRGRVDSPAFPMSRKNHTLPVRLRSSGTA